MPVPSSISDLSTTPALNSPPGSESPSSIDDYLRTLSAFIRQINDLAATKADASALAAKADDSAVVKLTGAQAVAGTKTFSASPVVPDATDPKHPVTKDQLDAKAPIASPAFTGVPTAPNPTAGTRSQALATMQMFANEFVASLAGNGYQKLPSGLIVQWGVTGYVGNGAVLAITFPITFPNGYLCALCNPISSGANTASYSASISSSPAPSVSAMTISNNSAGSGPLFANWLAIGW